MAGRRIDIPVRDAETFRGGADGRDAPAVELDRRSLAGLLDVEAKSRRGGDLLAGPANVVGDGGKGVVVGVAAVDGKDGAAADGVA